MFPISSNLEQGECESSVGGNGHSDTPTLMPHKNDALLINYLTGGQPESMLNLPSEQHKPFNPGWTGLTSMDPTDEGNKDDNDTPVSPRQSSRITRNQPPWRYQNFTLWHNDILPGAFNIWVGLCICLHIISCMCIVIIGDTMWRHSIWATTYLPSKKDS